MSPSASRIVSLVIGGLALLATVGCSGDIDTPADLKGLAIHEAGHTIVAWHTAYAIADYVVISENGGGLYLGYVANSPIDDAWHSCAISIAGAEATRLLLGDHPDYATRPKEGTTGDFQVINDNADALIAYQAAGQDITPSWFPKTERHWADRVDVLTTCAGIASDELILHADEVTKVFDALYAKYYLSKTEIASLIGPPVVDF